MSQVGIAWPPGPLCEVCGHRLCPLSHGPSCEELIDGLPCCPGGLCLVTAEDFMLWHREILSVERKPADFSEMAEGPWFPGVERRARGVLRKLYSPPPRFARAPAVCELLAQVAYWQGRHGCNPDGLIGPQTWRKKNAELECLAIGLKHELAAAKLTETRLYRFVEDHAR